ISGIMQRLGMEDGEAIQHPLVTRSIESAQARVEGRNFDIRKELLKFDDIMNSQRLSIYAERREILEGQDVSQRYRDFIEEIVDDAASGLHKSASNPDDDQAMTQNQSISDYLRSVFPLEVKQELMADADEFKEIFTKQALDIYAQKESKFGSKMMRGLERIVLLEVIDSKWKDHLRGMDELREGIGLRAYGQKDPIVEFRSEGYAMFEEMSRKIREDAVSFILRANPIKEEDLVQRDERVKQSDIRFLHPEASSAIKAPQQSDVPSAAPAPGNDPFGNLTQIADPGSPADTAKKIGRNDPCSCGSGKKFKKCCGA
ncbi:MAG: SEC-C domain-containing protein, partial [Candidatus Omnitrophica bacterium]|nr:SEC-C domain-containing protein [Candidatus Omnitrophota bacterium]